MARDTKIPVTMANCCSEPRRPRIRAGEVSAIYVGAITDATPTPIPPTTRNATINQTLSARPVPIALMKNSTAAIFMTEIRPIRSARRPAVMAPAAAPSNAEATAKPSAALLMPKWLWIEATAPLITALS